MARHDEGVKKTLGGVAAVQGVGMVITGTGAMAVNTAAPPVAIGPMGYGLTTLGTATFGIGVDIATAPYHSSEGARVLQSLETHAPTYLEMNRIEYGTAVFGLGGAKAVTHLGGKAATHAAKVEARLRTQAPKHDLMVMTREEAVAKGLTSKPSSSKPQALNTRSSLDNPLLKEPRVQNGVFKAEGGVVQDQMAHSSDSSAFAGGKLYPREKLTNLVQYLEKRGVYVYETKDNPAFRGKSDGTGQIGQESQLLCK